MKCKKETKFEFSREQNTTAAFCRYLALIIYIYIYNMFTFYLIIVLSVAHMIE